MVSEQQVVWTTRLEMLDEIWRLRKVNEELTVDRDRWRHWATEYLYTDPDCQCPLCDQVREAYEKAV